MTEPASRTLSHRERLRAALRGEPVDRPPVSLWQHFPGRDRTAGDLVAATLAFQARHDLDLIKLMPTGMYSVVDYGATIALAEGSGGSTRLVASPVQSPADWGRLPAARPDRGELAVQVEVVRRLRAALGPDVPFIQTIFSPLTMAHKLAGDRFAADLRSAEADLRQGLERFTADVIAFGRACLDAGADGFFFATQHASREAGLPDDTFERLGAAYDQRVLAALAEDERNWCSVLHLHGAGPRFELADRYPVHAVNWHDRETAPSISAALGQTRRALVAGIARRGVAALGTAGAAEQVREAIAQAGGRRLVVAPGCVLPVDLDPAILLALRQAVA
jgi:uroporphyrinogen decarboxylase